MSNTFERNYGVIYQIRHFSNLPVQALEQCYAQNGRRGFKFQHISVRERGFSVIENETCFPFYEVGMFYFSFDFDALLALTDENTTLAFVTSPDNPSGLSIYQQYLNKIIILKTHGLLTLSQGPYLLGFAHTSS